MNETKKLYRLDHGALAGVCGGVAEYFNVDANLVRLIWAVSYTHLTLPTILLV